MQVEAGPEAHRLEVAGGDSIMKVGAVPELPGPLTFRWEPILRPPGRTRPEGTRT